MSGHLAHELLGEGLRAPGRADQHRGPDLPDDLGEADPADLLVALPARHLGHRARVGNLEVAQVLAVVREQAVAPDTPETPGRLVAGEPGHAHRVPQLVRDADARRTRAVDDDAVLGQRYAAEPAGREHRGQADGSGALHVVVEGERRGAVAVEDPPGVARPEVLPVEQGMREEPTRGGDVGVDEGVVLTPLDPRVRDTEVERVVEQLLPVGADVEHDRERARRVDPRRRRVDVELALRDLDATDAPVADPEDPLGVGRDDEVDVVGSQTGRAQRALDAGGVLDGEVDPARSAVLVAVALDRLADGRGVDDGQHLGQVVAEQLEEQHLVAVVQRREEHVLGQVARLLEVLPVGAVGLLVDRQHPRRQQTHQPQ